jgi:hypothetical protein
MAKKNMIERERKRERLINKYGKKRTELKAALKGADTYEAAFNSVLFFPYLFISLSRFLSRSIMFFFAMFFLFNLLFFYFYFILNANLVNNTIYDHVTKLLERIQVLST